MKWLTLVLALCVSLPCAAQKNLLKELTGKGAVKQLWKKAPAQTAPAAAVPQVLRQARVAQGKILPGGKKPVFKPNVNLERYIFKKVAATDIDRLPLLIVSPTSDQWAQAAWTYLSVMKAFDKFKSEMNVFLYYQSKPSERHNLSGAERAVYMEKISQMHAKLSKLKNLVDAKDPAYKAAQEYVAFAAEMVNPMMRGVFTSQKVARQDRTFDENEFFMRDPHSSRAESLLAKLPVRVQVYQASRNLPKGLRMAVLNDRPSLLQTMQQLNKKALFFPGWSVSSFNNAEELLQAVTKKGEQFDVILCDIIVPGGGGYYVTAMLREKGFNGAIIALSSYGEQKKLGQAMFDKGFDGMISQHEGFEYGKEWPVQMMKRLSNYFYYRDLHGWKR